MTFQNPSFLFAGLAIAIPIAIHLFNLQRRKRVLFTNLKFLREVKEQTTAARRIRHLIILSLRCLALLGLVAAFAQPVLDNASNAKTDNQAVAVHIDNSNSMGQALAQGTSLDMAVRWSEQYLLRQSKQSRVLVSFNDGPSDGLIYRSVATANQQVTKIELSDRFKSIDAALRKIQAASEREGLKPKQVVYISDFQKSTTGAFEKLPLDSQTNYTFVPIQPQVSPNVYVDSIWVDNPFIKAKEVVEVKVSLTNTSAEPAQALPVKLLQDNRQVAAQLVNIEPNASQTITFGFVLDRDTVAPCRLIVEDAATAFDNETYFVLRPAPKIDVLHIGQEGKAYYEAAFASTAYYNFASFGFGAIDYQRIESSRLILVDNVATLNDGLISGLQAAIKRGAVIWLAPAANVNVPNLSQSLTKLSLPITGLAKDSITGNKPAAIQLPDLRQPFFAGVFQSMSEQTQAPSIRPILTWTGGIPVLKLKTGQSVLSQFEVGSGQVLLSAAPIGADFGSFAQHGFFPSILLRAAILSLKNNLPLAQSLQSPTLRIPATRGKDVVLVSGKDKYYPSVSKSAEFWMLDLPVNEMAPGFYQLMLDGQAQLDLAFNRGKSESELATYTVPELKAALASYPNATVTGAVSEEASLSQIKFSASTQDLWPYALFFTLGALLLESLLLRLWK